jgi:hypothetical protein
LRRRWGGVAIMAAACSLLATSARAEPPAALTTYNAYSQLVRADGPTPVAQLEARADELARKYRGQLEMLTGAETAAKAAAGRVKALDGQLAAAHQHLARLAAASYMGSPPDQALAFLSGGDPRQALGRSVTVEYLAQQRDAREQQVQRLVVAGINARQAAQVKVDGLRTMVDSLAGQQKRVKQLLAKFHPQSPVIGDSITPRMRAVRDEVDRRYGPFSAIGCYRPGSDGEHPLGRACDFMLSTGGVMPAASSIQLGYDIAAWAQANASRLGIMYIIYRQRIWDIRSGSSDWVPMEDRGSITANHYDHVHISVF